jgi:hypothetical protein
MCGQFSSISASWSSDSRHSRERSDRRLTPETRSAQSDSDGDLNVYARCEEITPMACSTALRESRPNTAGWLIHSRLDSSSASSARMVLASMPAAGVKGLFAWGEGVRGRVSPPLLWVGDELPVLPVPLEASFRR